MIARSFHEGFFPDQNFPQNGQFIARPDFYPKDLFPAGRFPERICLFLEQTLARMKNGNEMLHKVAKFSRQHLTMPVALMGLKGTELYYIDPGAGGSFNQPLSEFLLNSGV